MMPWLGLAGLGALHGINPGMGWLFAVALGLQEGRGSAVWRALPPLAVGHAVAIGVVVTLAVGVGMVIPMAALRWIVAALLLTMGVYRLFRHSHPRYGGMRVGPRDLAVWSFLMATAHGAGLMVLPIVMGMPAAAHHGGHMAHATPLAASAVPAHWQALSVTVVHTLGYLLVAGVVAVVVYEKLGIRMLRTAWVNLDLVWSVALILTAVATPLFYR